MTILLIFLGTLAFGAFFGWIGYRYGTHIQSAINKANQVEKEISTTSTEIKDTLK